MDIEASKPVDSNNEGSHDTSENKDAKGTFTYWIKSHSLSACVLQATHLRKYTVYERRNNIGGWKTMPFIIGNEFCDKLATMGLSRNLILYLTQYYHLDQVTTANTLHIVSGTSNLAPLLGGYLADNYLGRFRTVLFAALINLLAMIVFLLTATVPSLKPVQCVERNSTCQRPSQGQLSFLYMAFLFTILSAAGIRPCAYAFGADQFRQNTPEEKKAFQSYFNWYFATIYTALLLSSTVIVYVQQNVSWGWGFGIPTIVMTVSILIFMIGSPLYNYVSPAGSPVKRLARVVVAAFHKRHLSLPSSGHYLRDDYYPNFKPEDQIRVHHTDNFRFLDKAAIALEGDLGQDGKIINPWELCTQNEVEDLKIILRLLPIWAAGILHAMGDAQKSTFVILQANSMNRQMGPSFQIPAASLSVFSTLALIMWLPLYDSFVLPFARRISGHERGITILQRIGIGYFLGAVAMVLAGLVESKRRSVAQSSNLTNHPHTAVPMSAFWLVPQLCLMGLSEAFNGIGHTELYYDQFPESMRSTAGAFAYLSSGIGAYMSSILLTLVHKSTRRNGEVDWLSDNLNRGHLDYFYYIIAGLLAANLVYFVICSQWYTYKRSERESDGGSAE